MTVVLLLALSVLRPPACHDDWQEILMRLQRANTLDEVEALTDAVEESNARPGSLGPDLKTRLWLELSAAWLRAGDADRALEALRWLGTGSFGAHLAPIYRAEVQIERGDWQEATQEVRKACVLFVDEVPQFLSVISRIDRRVRQAWPLQEPRAYELVWNLSQKWLDLGRVARSLALLELLEDCPEEPYRSYPILGRAMCYRSLGEREKAIEVLRAVPAPSPTVIRGPEAMGNHVRAEAYKMLIATCEESGQWKEALRLREQWRPVSFCGMGAASRRREWNFQILRAHFEAGERGGVLDAVWDLMTETMRNMAPVVSRRWSIRYVELAALAGRLEEARQKIADIGGSRRDHLFAEPMALAEFFVAGNADGIVRWMDETQRSQFIPELALRFLTTLGPAASECLARHLSEGTSAAFFLAEDSSFTELIPVLEHRWKKGPDRGREQFSVRRGLLKLHRKAGTLDQIGH